MDSNNYGVRREPQRTDAGDVAYALVNTRTGETLAGGIVSYATAVRWANAVSDELPAEGLDGAAVATVEPVTLRESVAATFRAHDVVRGSRAHAHGGAAARPCAHYAGARVSERRRGVTREALDALARIAERAIIGGGGASWQ